MKVDRILLDLIEWVRKLLLSKHDESIKLPYELLGDPMRYPKGTLRRVRILYPKVLAERTVDAWIFNPFPSHKNFELSRSRLKDIYIFLDHLAAIPGAKTSLSRIYTHQLTILEADHNFLSICGDLLEFETDLLFKNVYDFQGRSSYRDRYAIVILHEVAISLADRGISESGYDLRKVEGQKLLHGEIEIARKRYLGSGYRVNPFTVE